MVRSMVRLELADDFKMKYRYTREQKGALDDLIALLKEDVREKSEASEVAVIEGYHRLCWELVHASQVVVQEKWGSPIERFLWLRALGADGTFSKASDVTPILAKLKYFCRLVTLYEGLSTYSRMDPQQNPVE